MTEFGNIPENIVHALLSVHTSSEKMAFSVDYGDMALFGILSYSIIRYLYRAAAEAFSVW